jgi:thiosulfate reductase cytochrome b subunit
MGVSSDANLQMQICIGILSLNDDAMPALDRYPGSREEVSQRHFAEVQA